MIYCSIDIETTGLESESFKILSVGAIIEDTTKKLPFDELPKFNAIVLQRTIVGSPFAITMNSEIIKLIDEYLRSDDKVREMIKKHTKYVFLEEDMVAKEFYWWLGENGLVDQYNDVSGGHVMSKDGKLVPVITSNTKPVYINVAGKNFGTFDKLFLEKLPYWKKLIKFRHKILDPAILCVDWEKDDSLPSLLQCKERMEIPGDITHNALEDAWDVVQILRKNY